MSSTDRVPYEQELSRSLRVLGNIMITLSLDHARVVGLHHRPAILTDGRHRHRS